ncbi:pyrimidine reductase family protein [Haloechinothrix salitolerans]|uniref:pyrimidine reductase family protein n=1 Tax=Haloechinothrix salitolerans TaxID=926830 RepID=UPI0031E7A4A1
MHALWPLTPEPASDGPAPAPISDADLERIYAYPDDLDRPWVQVNFVSSADGAAALGGLSEGLSHPADKRIFALGRDLADVVLVGAGTATAEQYTGVKRGERRRERRQRFGLAAIPPIAVVSARCSLPVDCPLLTDTLVPPIVFTTDAAPHERRTALADAGAEVVVAGDGQVHLPSVLHELGARGLRRVNCEGGPRLLASMVAGDLVDQLCLTLAPVLAGAGAERIVAGAVTDVPRELTLASVLHEDGFLMLRYRRR